MDDSDRRGQQRVYELCIATHGDGDVDWRSHGGSEAHVVVLEDVARKILDLKLAGGVDRSASVAAVAHVVDHFQVLDCCSCQPVFLVFFLFSDLFVVTLSKWHKLTVLQNQALFCDCSNACLVLLCPHSQWPTQGIMRASGYVIEWIVSITKIRCLGLI